MASSNPTTPAAVDASDALVHERNGVLTIAVSTAGAGNSLDDAALAAALDRALTAGAMPTGHDSTRAGFAALKDTTSRLIGHFVHSVELATRERYGTGRLTRFAADVVVPEETETEIAVMKGIAAAYVMTAEQRQPLYARQREVLAELVTLLDATGDRYLEPMFAFDWAQAPDDAARRRVVIDQIASLTDSTAVEWHHTLVQGAEFRRVWL